MKIIQDDEFYMDEENLFAQIRSIATSLERIADSFDSVLYEIHAEQHVSHKTHDYESNSCTSES
jgi:hypothetical protein